MTTLQIDDDDTVVAKAKEMGVSLYVATPAREGNVWMDWHRSMVNLIMGAGSAGLPLKMQINGHGWLTRVRNELVADFRKTDCTHLLFIDADMSFNAVDAFRLPTLGYPIVGGVYALRGSGSSTSDTLDWSTIHRAVSTGFPPEALPAVTVGEWSSRSFDGELAADGTIATPAVATGFMCVRRDVFDVIEKDHPDLRYGMPRPNGIPEKQVAFFDYKVVSGVYRPEDYAFCDLARSCGFESRAYLPALLGHRDGFVNTGNLLEKMVAVRQQRPRIERPAMVDVATTGAP